jgi:putative redox protein
METKLKTRTIPFPTSHFPLPDSNFPHLKTNISPMKTSLTWKKTGLQFESTDEKGNTVVLDGNSEIGSSPMTMLLHALAGCTAADVVSILEKMQQPVSGLLVGVDAERAPEGTWPRPWAKMHLTYEVQGDVQREKALRAIELSMEKYCSVSAMLGEVAEITWELKG